MKAFDLPAGLAGKPLAFRLGVVDDGDAAYFNGEKIGSTSPDDVPDSWDFKRVYAVPGPLVKAGRNVVAVRCYDSGHAGGLAGPEILLEAEDGTVVDLAGPWKINWEQMLQPRPWPPDYLPLVKIYHQGAVLYHAMCAPEPIALCPLSEGSARVARGAAHGNRLELSETGAQRGGARVKTARRRDFALFAGAR